MDAGMLIAMTTPRWMASTGHVAPPRPESHSRAAHIPHATDPFRAGKRRLAMAGTRYEHRHPAPPVFVRDRVTVNVTDPDDRDRYAVRAEQARAPAVGAASAHPNPRLVSRPGGAA